MADMRVSLAALPGTPPGLWTVSTDTDVLRQAIPLVHRRMMAFGIEGRCNAALGEPRPQERTVA